MSDEFAITDAKREAVPLLVGLFGPSGSGKTYSMLRLAAGMQKVVGGDIYVIDTESKRALHYAEDFTFKHLAFGAPYSPLRYRDAIEQCAKQGAGIICVDSMSHEHEGPGGVLDQHDQILDKRAGDDWKRRQQLQFGAWAEPKAQRRALISAIVTELGVNAIFCFRAKEKMVPKRGGEPTQLGWMPIAGDEFVYEMTVNALLEPASAGTPNWKPERVGERQMVKLPKQFESVFLPGHVLCEEDGTAMAEWAKGGKVAAPKKGKAAAKPQPGPEPAPALPDPEAEIVVNLDAPMGFGASKDTPWREVEPARLKSILEAAEKRDDPVARSVAAHSRAALEAAS